MMVDWFLNFFQSNFQSLVFQGFQDEMPIWQSLALLFGSGSNFGIDAFKWPQPRPKYPVKQPLASLDSLRWHPSEDLSYKEEDDNKDEDRVKDLDKEEDE